MSGFDDPVDEKRIRDSIAARVALERPEKPVQEFLGGESYHPTSTGTKRTGEAPKASTIEIEELIKIMEKMANAPKEEYGKRQPGERGAYERA